MKDIRSVLAEKEAQLTQTGKEVAALRIAIKLCEDEKPPDKPAENP